ncbi:hypothetical protein HPL003_25155 [Paenibacillus terrae HPL-003]|uniref:Uncharacterized protein n=1 Tax=Paenibacillus terrae (strain HPL-003) TaxID=985665 RepID=G7VPV6_PAETH|nr:hypothetical protein HPL003_25155 [Paenibacillus terrae HPL-003]
MESANESNTRYRKQKEARISKENTGYPISI